MQMKDQARRDKVNRDQPQRISFLLRLWCEDQTGHSNWRASLQLPGTGEHIGFASLEQLFMYLVDLTEGQNFSQENGNTE
jgi:hypothetical protein